jgi:hypothetical protein
VVTLAVVLAHFSNDLCIIWLGLTLLTREVSHKEHKHTMKNHEAAYIADDDEGNNV